MIWAGEPYDGTAIPNPFVSTCLVQMVRTHTLLSEIAPHHVEITFHVEHMKGHRYAFPEELPEEI